MPRDPVRAVDYEKWHTLDAVGSGLGDVGLHLCRVGLVSEHAHDRCAVEAAIPVTSADIRVTCSTGMPVRLPM